MADDKHPQAFIILVLKGVRIERSALSVLPILPNSKLVLIVMIDCDPSSSVFRCAIYCNMNSTGAFGPSGKPRITHTIVRVRPDISSTIE